MSLAWQSEFFRIPSAQQAQRKVQLRLQKPGAGARARADVEALSFDLERIMQMTFASIVKAHHKELQVVTASFIVAQDAIIKRLDDEAAQEAVVWTTLMLQLNYRQPQRPVPIRERCAFLYKRLRSVKNHPAMVIESKKLSQQLADHVIASESE